MNQKVDYIFSINTGRSGSEYLNKLFNHVESCQSFHEPNPVCNAKAMYRYSLGDPKKMIQLVEEKVNTIKDKKDINAVYVETNHCFIKGFGWLLPQYFAQDKIGVIILKRDKSKIARSLLRIGCSPINNLGRDWISTPNMKAPLVEPPTRFISPAVTYHCARFIKRYLLRPLKHLLRTFYREPQWLINYELECLEWYVEETNAKADAYRHRYPNIRYYEVDINDLNNPDCVHKMLEYFGCSEKDSLNNILGKPTNLKLPEH